MNWQPSTEADWKTKVLAVYPAAVFALGGLRDSIRIYAHVGEKQVGEYIVLAELGQIAHAP